VCVFYLSHQQIYIVNVTSIVMAKIVPAGRIARTGRFIERPKQVIQTVSSPAPTKQLTKEQITQMEKEFYSKRGTEQTKLLSEKIQDRVKAVERYRQQVENANKRKDKGKASALEGALNRLSRAEETLSSYQSMQGKASSGKYRFVDIISAAQGEAFYKAEKVKFETPSNAPTEGIMITDPTTGKRTLTSEKGYERMKGDAEIIEAYKAGDTSFTQQQLKTIEYYKQQPSSEIYESPKQSQQYFKSDINSPTGDGYIKTSTVAGPTDFFQEEYIQSLTTSPTTNLEVTKYGGVSLPYGQKDVKWYEPQFGTITTDIPTGVKKVSLIKEMKTKELISPTISMPSEVIVQKEAEKISTKISSELSPVFQEKINIGELTVKEAETKFKEEASKQFDIKWGEATGSKSFKEQIKASEQFRGQFAEAFSPEYKEEKFKKTVEFGADILAAGVTTVAPPIGIAYFAAKGAWKASRGAEKDIRVAEYSPSGDLFLPTYPKLIPSKESEEAGMSFLFSGISGIGYVGKIGGEITALRKAEIIKKPWTVTSQELFKEGDKTYLRVSGSKTIGTASAEGETIFPIQMGEKGEFKILAGRGKVNIRVEDFMKNLQGYEDPIIRSSVDFGLVGKGNVSPGFARVGGLNVVSEPKIFVTSGEGYVTPDLLQNIKVTQKNVPSQWWNELKLGQGPGKNIVKPVIDIEGTYIGDTTTQFTFGGLSRKEGEKVLYTSGKLLKARLYPTETRFTGLFKSEVFGETLVKETPITTSFKSFQGGGAKSSKEFLDDLYKPVQKVITKQISKPSVIPKIVGEQFAGQSFVSTTQTAGTGLEITSSLAPQITTLFGVAAKPIIKIKPLTFIKSIDRNISRSKTKQNVIIKGDSLSKQATKLFSDVSATTDSLQDYVAKTGLKSQTKQIQKQVTETIPPAIFMPSPSNFPFTPTQPGSGKISLPLWLSGKPVVSIAKKKQGYIPQAKTKGGKWMSLSKKPMTRTSALSRAARASDNTTSAQFRIKKAKGKISPKKDNYFGRTSNKYRPYRIKKGKPIKLHDQFIEKRGKRIDTLGEKKGLKLAKYVKQQRWLIGTIKKKPKKKNPWLI